MHMCSHHSVYDELEHTLINSSRHLPHPSLLTSHLHIVPDFHGNRSPLADPTFLGMVKSLNAVLYCYSVYCVCYLRATNSFFEELNAKEKHACRHLSSYCIVNELHKYQASPTAGVCVYTCASVVCLLAEGYVALVQLIGMHVLKVSRAYVRGCFLL